MKNNIARFMGIMLVVVISSGCVQAATGTPKGSGDPNALFTQAAQTVIAQLTSEAGQTAVAMLTQMAQVTPTPTPTATLVPPTSTPSATATPPPPTNTPTPYIPCDWGEFIKDISVPEGTTFLPGDKFTKTWRLKNIGSCTWTSDYALVFSGGSQMDGSNVVYLPGTVRQGETVDISVDLIAPTQSGTYTGRWQLRNGAGVLFGVGPDRNEAFSVKITVVAGSTIIYDFTRSYCNAEWRNNQGLMLCPSTNLDESIGFIYLDGSALIENGSWEDEPALVMHPDGGVSGPGVYIPGRIDGKFPEFTVRIGDHFKTVIGCLFDRYNCNIVFQLNYHIGNGPLQTLESWNEVYDGSITKIETDLSLLAGKTVTFVLTVLDNGSTSGDWAFWLYPRIFR